MRPVLVVVLCATTLQSVAAQVQYPRGHLYRGPMYITREATVVEPEPGLPLEFSNSSLLNGFHVLTTIRSKTVRSIPVSGITIRVAFGPTAQGMITFRARPSSWPPAADRIGPDRSLPLVRFSIAPEDPTPGVLALTPDMKIVFTLERIDSGDGTVIFENPDATELLWVALDRPRPSGR